MHLLYIDFHRNQSGISAVGIVYPICAKGEGMSCQASWIFG